MKGTEPGSNNSALGMAQKLLLFWRKPARRCWWEGVELSDVDGVQGKLKVWIRRVWTLEMVSIFAALSLDSLLHLLHLWWNSKLTGFSERDWITIKTIALHNVRLQANEHNIVGEKWDTRQAFT